jgi:hypothetical protein
MKFRIHHTPSGDSVVIEEDTFQAVKHEVQLETYKRGWKEDDCWSENLDD